MNIDHYLTPASGGISPGAQEDEARAQDAQREQDRCTCALEITYAREDCQLHGIAASNQRQDAYWRRVGGHD